MLPLGHRILPACFSVSLSLMGMHAHGAVLLATSFDNASISGTTMQGVVWTTENGLTGTTDLTASTNLFTSGAAAAANGFFSVNQNINGSTSGAPAWTTTWTITVGASDMQLDDITLFSVEHNSSGTLGAGNGTTVINLQIVDNNTTGTIANQTLDKDISNATPEQLTYDFGGSPLTLTSGNTYDVTFTLWEESSSGNFEAFTEVSFNGDAIPEPSSLALIGLGGLLMLRRSRR